MGTNPTKAANNVYCQARKGAATYNDRLYSREGAAELLGLSVSSLADYELGNTKVVPVDKVVLMSDLYRAPELLNHYCATECPIGCRNAQLLEVAELDRLTLKLLGKFRGTDNIAQTLLDVVADGVITPDEEPQIESVLQQLEEISKYTQELRLWVQKHVK